MNRRYITLLTVVAFAALADGPAHAVDQGWLRKVSQLITANYTYPRSAQLRGEQGSAKVKISFSTTGKVLAVDLIQSTGSAILDREAVRIPMKVGNFPTPPSGTTYVVFPIAWQMN